MITKKEFEDESFKFMTTTSKKVLDILKENKDSAYTTKEICGIIKISQPSVAIALKKLNQLGVVEVKKPYYMFKEQKSGGKRPAAKKEESDTDEAEDTE